MSMWIAMDNDEKSGQDSIIGMYDNEIDAKIGIAEHVLEHGVDTEYLEMFEQKVSKREKVEK